MTRRTVQNVIRISWVTSRSSRVMRSGGREQFSRSISGSLKRIGVQLSNSVTRPFKVRQLSEKTSLSHDNQRQVFESAGTSKKLSRINRKNRPGAAKVGHGAPHRPRHDHPHRADPAERLGAAMDRFGHLSPRPDRSLPGHLRYHRRYRCHRRCICGRHCTPYSHVSAVRNVLHCLGS